MKKTLFLFLFLFPLFTSCELSVVQLPCIFGEWTIVRIQSMGGQTIESFHVNDTFILKPMTMINFQKNDEAIINFSGSARFIQKFKFSSEGFRFLNESEEIWAKDIDIVKDTLLIQMDSILIRMERPKID